MDFTFLHFALLLSLPVLDAINLMH